MDIITLAAKIIPDTSPAFTSTVVVAGFFGVLLLLTVLIIVFSLFSKTVSKTQKSKGRKKEEKAIMTEDLKVVSPFAAPEAPVVPPVAQEQAVQGVSEEIVAAISAAVYMLEGENAVVASITPIRKNPINTRNPWAMAAIVQNTTPF